MKTAVKEVMTSRVIWITKDAPYKEMAARLRENRVGAFPVLDDEGKVIGVVSEADLLTKEALAGGYDGMPGMITGVLCRKEQGKARGITAADLMTRPAVTISADAAVENAAKLMYKSKIKRLPVVDAAGHLTGIISRADVLSVFDRSDDEVRSEITDCLLDEFLVDPAALAVTVKDSVVTLTGVPENNELGHQIVQRVRHIPGVVAVRDRLNYSSPEG